VSMSTKTTTLISAPYSSPFKHFDPTDPTLLVRGAIHKVRDLPRVREDPRTSACAHHRGRRGAQGGWHCAAEGMFSLHSDTMCCVLRAISVIAAKLRRSCLPFAFPHCLHHDLPALPLPLSPEAQLIWLFDCSTVIMIG
jgi:hypothetical protein